MQTKPIEHLLPKYAREELEAKMAEYKAHLQNDKELRQFFVNTRRAANQCLTDEIQLTLDDIRNSRIAPPYVRLRGMPIDDISGILTPTNGYLSTQKETMIAEAVQLGICQMIGAPYAFLLERRNAGLIHLIAGRPGQEYALTSESSASNLDWHVEQAFSSLLCPHWVTLLCLRQDPEKQAATGLVDIRDVIPFLTEESLTILREPIFGFRLPDSFGDVNAISTLMPVIGGPLGDPEFRFSLEGKMLVVDSNPVKEANGYKALNELSNLMNRPELQYKVLLEPGDLLLMNNMTTAHCRTAFKVHEHGLNRWLHRIIVRSSLFEGRAMRSKQINQFK